MTKTDETANVPDWLKVGAEVAFVYANGSRMKKVTVKRIGKRDVVVDDDGREQRFNLKYRWSYGDVPWLKAIHDRWTHHELGPLDSERAKKVMRAEQLADARFRAGDAFDHFRQVGDEESARFVIDAIEDWLRIYEQ